MTHASIGAARLLHAVQLERQKRAEKNTADAAPIARLSMLESLATFVAKDKAYDNEVGTGSRVIQISAEDLALIADQLYVPTK